jgi:undecaprenyl-diphosphatase
MRWHVRPTAWDREVARFVARRTTPSIERTAQAVALAGDEHILAALAAAVWLASRGAPAPARRRVDHLAASALAAIAVSHLTKDLFWQQRPDRRFVRAWWRGVPLIGKATDSFPSGHALQTGAIAAAIAHGWPRTKGVVAPVCALVAAARVILLAHWPSDVLAGIAGGMIIERLMRFHPAGGGRRAGKAGST